MGILNPKTFVEPSGLFEGRATVKAAKFVLHDYNGKLPTAIPVLQLSLVGADGTEFEGYWSAGRPEDWQPSQDGRTLIPVGRAQALNNNSNLAIFLRHLVDAGFPEELLDQDDITVLEGLDADFVRIPGPERRGRELEGKRLEILVVSTIHQVPGFVDTNALKEEARSVVMQALSEAKNKKLLRKNLPGAMMTLLADNPRRSEIMQMAFDEQFLSEGPWTYADGTLSL